MFWRIYLSQDFSQDAVPADIRVFVPPFTIFGQVQIIPGNKVSQLDERVTHVQLSVPLKVLVTIIDALGHF